MWLRAFPLSFLLYAACARSTPPPETAPVSPPAEPASAAPVEQQPPAKPASAAPAQQPKNTDQPRLLLPYGCVGTREAERACLAQGEGCRLAPWPERHPCAGQGALCRDDQMREHLRDRPCGCTCSAAFRQREESVRDRSQEPQCRELRNLNDGTIETVCEPPELPR